MYLKNKWFFCASKLLDCVFILLIHVKMPTIDGILLFMSRLNFMLSWSEHDKSFITLRPGCWATTISSDADKQYVCGVQSARLEHWRHCAVFLSKTLYHSTSSLQPNVWKWPKMCWLESTASTQSKYTPQNNWRTKTFERGYNLLKHLNSAKHGPNIFYCLCP